MKIEMVDLRGQYQHIKEEIDQATLSVIRDAQFINGPEVTKFAKELSVYLDGAYVIPCANGTDALQISMMALDLMPGDEVIATNDLYGGSYRMFTKIFEPLGIKFHFVNMYDADAIKNHINTNTKMIWVETPTNPTMQIIDIRKCAAIAKENNLILVVDNTFASPYLQNPLEMGATIVMHSVTKYLGGHSDVVMGAICTNDKALYDRLAFIHNSCGATPGPMDSFLVLRGIKTLHVRMDRHCDNGEVIANFLRNHPKVDKVYWPGFPDHPNHDIAKSQMKRFGGMISFTLKDATLEETFAMASKVRVFSLAESLGGVESLLNHPATMTHASIPKEEREKAGVTDGLIRLSVGIEHIDDLIADLTQAIG